MNTYQITTKAAEFGISVDSAIMMRIRYLVDLCGAWDDYMAGKSDEIPEDTAMDALYEIDRLKKYRRTNKTPITDEMIEAAKQYPIERLIDFTHGVSLAWCHEDKRPSLSWWKDGNRARCFVCDQTFNPIDVLTERDGMTFIQAVKELAQ